jgi:hypothetical protein
MKAQPREIIEGRRPGSDSMDAVRAALFTQGRKSKVLAD